MTPELRAWVCEFYGRNLPVIYGSQEDSRPYTVGSKNVLFVGANWIKRYAEEDPELKRLLVLDSL